MTNINKENLKLAAALKYEQMGLSIIPAGADKKPLIAWKEYQDRRAIPAEIEGWFEKYPSMNIGIVTGKISGIVVVDIEKNGKSDGYPATVMAKSGGDGIHLYYKYPGYEILNGVRVRELTDIRGDGGYVLAPPSISDKGEYKWILSPEDSAFSEMPEWITKAGRSKEKGDKKWLSGKDGVSEGSRNDTAASMAGKIISSTAPELLDSIGWEQLKIWNSKNTPPLSETELKSTWDSIINAEDSDIRGDGKATQASMFLELFLTRKDIVLFHDEQNAAYISLDIDGHQEVWPLKSKSIKRYISREFYNTQNKAAGSETIKSILGVLEGMACFEGSEIKLQDRATWHDGELWYDLTNKKWQAVKITKDGWEIVDKPPILFKRYSHHKSQVMPVRNGNVNLFLDYINITNPEHRLLMLVHLISCFIPDFPHVMLVAFGAQGSSKSTLSKLARLTVDPSLTDVVALPTNQKELVQVLAHHYFLFFDNVSFISEKSSDTLCKAITGSGFSKRELYSDDEDIIYTFKRNIGINGINLVTTRPDLLERSLLLELARIDPTDRKTESELYENFKKDLPSILGGIFNVVVGALQIQPTLKLRSHHRMADWALWGCAIAEALGYKKEIFLEAYENNITRQTEMLLNENIVATAIITFMEDKDEWKNTPTELLHKLSTHASFTGIDTREKYWPNGANSLSHKLNVLSTPLKQMGISVVISTTGIERYIHIRKIAKTSTAQSDPITQIDDTDDTDDIIPPTDPEREFIYPDEDF